jgi:hypothetical protein
LYRYTKETSVAKKMPGAIKLSGYPELPWSHTGFGPVPPCLSPLKAVVPDFAKLMEHRINEMYKLAGPLVGLYKLNSVYP